MAGRVPSVMVSSTFFDLREVRRQIQKMAEDDLGYRVLISESPTFPIEPDAAAIDNCRKRVEHDADILVLVIGSRYGSVEAKSGKSVTSIEYLAARAKAIPIYVFIERRVLTLADARLAVPEADRRAFSATVDNASLFDLVDRIRSVDKAWVNGFDIADDITSALRVQFAYLTMRGLALQAKISQFADRAFLESLPAEAFQLVIEEPRGWEWLLFAVMLNFELDAAADQRRLYDLGIVYDRHASISSVESIPRWVADKANEAGALIDAASKLVNQELAEAFAPPGVRGDARRIVFVARQLGAFYRRLIDWAQDIRRTRVDSDFQPALESLARLTEDCIHELGDWGTSLLDGIKKALLETEALEGTPGEKKWVKFSLKFDVDAALAQSVIDQLNAAIRSRGYEV